MKYFINKKLYKYKQTFLSLSTRPKKSTFIRYKHRLTAWYILHKYNLHYALVYLAKHTNILRVIKNEFIDYLPEIEHLYDINLYGPNKSYFKQTLLDGSKLCEYCGGRSIKNTRFCSNKCSNMFKAKSSSFTKKISNGLKKYYKNADNNILLNRYNKTRDTLLDNYSNMSPDEIKLKCSNKNIRYTAYDNFEVRLPTLKLNCDKKYFYENETIPIICECGNKFVCNMSTSFYPICKKCNPNIKHKTQDEIYNIVHNIDENTYCDSRKIIAPLELDIYSEKYNFAIEYDGLIWHSYGKSKSEFINNYQTEINNKHLEKTILCENKNIFLFHIFENEWLDSNKRNIWKSMIMNKMNLSNRIYARKCSIQELESKVSNEFLDINHMQGGCRASTKIGLFYENELVQVMTLGKPRFNKKYEYEIIRIAGKLGTSVIGGASKMLRYFERNYKPKSIISYANRRWSKGNVYKQLGFELSHISVPNYFYFKGNSGLMSRNKFQKHKLNNLLENYNSKYTETENMYNNGYRKIYDCGNLVYIKEYKY